MPLTPKGEKVMQSMQDQYGAKKGEQVFYASANAGKIKGVHESAERKALQEAGRKLKEVKRRRG